MQFYQKTNTFIVNWYRIIIHRNRLYHLCFFKWVFNSCYRIFILSFSMAYANTGFNTFYQNNVPVHIMGRIGSIYGLFIAGITILITILFGVATQFISIQLVVIIGSLVMLFITIILCVFTLLPSHSKVHSSESIHSK